MRAVAAGRRGSSKVGMFWEQGSSGKDYADYFRDTALQLGLDRSSAR